MKSRERAAATRCGHAQCGGCDRVLPECTIVTIVDYSGHDCSLCSECRGHDACDDMCRVCDPAGWAESDAWNAANGFAPYPLP
jgi:hypothetical protein